MIDYFYWVKPMRFYVYRVHKVLPLIVMLLASVQTVYGQAENAPQELSFIVYTDGYVSVDYTLNVDPTKVSVNVSLFGTQYEDLLVEDQDGGGLDHSPIDGGITVDSLGSASIMIVYVTPDLTGKAGQIWTFTASTPIPSAVLLPEGSNIFDFDPFPIGMSSLNGHLLLTMPEGEIEVSYIVGVVGTREHALAVIKDAEEFIQAVKDEGVITDEADDLLEGAYSAFDSENYVEAEELAGQAKTLAQSVREAALSAIEAIASAEATIAAAEESGATVGLDEAKSLLQQAEEAHDGGDYSGAKDLAEQAYAKAASATVPSQRGIPTMWLVGGGGLVLLVVIGALLMRGRGKPRRLEARYTYDLDELFEEKPHLRMDDKEMIRFLAESGGEAFAAEVRDRFEIPRTSLWRMIRRLEGEEVVVVETIGGQSLVKIAQKYRTGGSRR